MLSCLSISLPMQAQRMINLRPPSYRLTVIDSLTKVLPLINDSLKVKHYVQMAQIYSTHSMQENMYDAIAKAMKISNMPGNAKLKDLIFPTLWNEIDNPKLHFFTEQMRAYNYSQIARGDKYIIRFVTLSIRSAEYYYNLGMLTRSKEIIDSCMMLRDSIDSSNFLAAYHLNMASYTSKTGSTGKALSHIDSAIALASGLSDQVLQTTIHRITLKIYLSNKASLNQALSHAKKLLSIYHLQPDYQNINPYDLNLSALVFAKKGLFKEADSLYKKSLEISRLQNNLILEVISLYELAQLHKSQDKFVQAREYALSSLKLARHINRRLDILKNLILLVSIESHLGNLRDADMYLEEYELLHDKFQSDVSIQTATHVQLYKTLMSEQSKNEALTRQKMAQEQSLINEKNINLILNFLVLGLVIVSIVALSLFIHDNRRRKVFQRLNQRLLAQKEQLENSNGEMNDLLSIVSHDLRAPMNRLQGLLDLLWMTIGQPSSEQLNYKSKMYTEINGVKTLISEILKSQTIESELKNETIENVDFWPILDQSLEMYSKAADEKQIRLERFVKIQPYMVIASPLILTRILDNLISNAIKFSKAGTSVEVQLIDLPKEKQVVLEVRDQGPGFTKEDKARLFSKFAKLSARPTHGESSTGLGLAIVKKLADKIHARIELEERKGYGAVFKVVFATGVRRI